MAMTKKDQPALEEINKGLHKFTNRELDALVAEKVMGWRRIGKGWHTKPGHRPSKDFPGTVINDYECKGPHDFLVPPGSDGSFNEPRVAYCGCESTTEIPMYSEYIEQAWQVVEKMREKGLLVHIIFDHTYDRHNWEVGFNKPNIMAEDCNYSYEETASLAIVKAALEALNDS